MTKDVRFLGGDNIKGCGYTQDKVRYPVQDFVCGRQGDFVITNVTLDPPMSAEACMEHFPEWIPNPGVQKFTVEWLCPDCQNTRKGCGCEDCNRVGACYVCSPKALEVSTIEAAREEEILDAIDAWHEGDGEGQELHEYLGWTVAEYDHWVYTNISPSK